MSTSLPRKLEWLRPYLELSRPLLPRGKKIVRVGAWTKGNRYGSDCHASIHTDDQKNYRIWINLFHWTGGRIPFSRIELIGLLAHELAHTVDMYHSPKHKKLEAKLLITFMTRLRQEGYVNEEEELNTK